MWDSISLWHSTLNRSTAYNKNMFWEKRKGKRQRLKAIHPRYDVNGRQIIVKTRVQ